MLQTPGCRDCSAEPRPLDCRNAGGAPEEKFWPATWPATSYVNQSTAAQYGSPVRQPSTAAQYGALEELIAWEIPARATGFGLPCRRTVS